MLILKTRVHFFNCSTRNFSSSIISFSYVNGNIFEFFSFIVHFLSSWTSQKKGETLAFREPEWYLLNSLAKVSKRIPFPAVGSSILGEIGIKEKSSLFISSIAFDSGVRSFMSLIYEEGTKKSLGQVLKQNQQS